MVGDGVRDGVRWYRRRRMMRILHVFWMKFRTWKGLCIDICIVMY